MRTVNRATWSSKWVFILAAAGAAVGLGNIWKFPYIAGENGGGAFVLVYLGCVLIVGLPIMMAEIALGRRGQANPADAVYELAKQENARFKKFWYCVGFLGVISSIIILSYYSVIAGWAIDYSYKAFAGDFAGITAAKAHQQFIALTSSPYHLMVWHTVMMLASIFIVGRGIRRGLEIAATFLFPAMLVLMFLLLFSSIESGYFGQGVSFLFHPDFSKLSTEGFLSALGHAFFTLSVATGSIMTYGSYLPKNISITTAACWIVGVDTFVALLAGCVIFPIVFAHGLVPSAGPGLLFETLPISFGQMHLVLIMKSQK